MGWCTAPNCTNSRNKVFKMFRFPRCPERRKRWLQNCRRDNWTPTDHSELCEIHFEESQFERNRQDGVRKLTPCAVPTVFDVPNPPKKIDKCRQSVFTKTTPSGDSSNDINYNNFNDQTTDYSVINNATEMDKMNEKLKTEISLLKAQINNLEEEAKKKENALREFLSEEQMEVALKGTAPRKWQDSGIVKGLKFRFTLGGNGYEFLRENKYPLPSYSTLNNRLKNFNLDFGVFKDILEPIKHKVECLDAEDRWCILSVDEMQINPKEVFCKHKKEIMGGKTTIGSSNKEANKLLVVLLRGVKNPWKQIIGAHITDGSLSNKLFKDFLEECILYVEKCGMRVICLSSDMGSSNTAMWNAFGIQVKKDGIRNNIFTINEHNVFVMSDVCHLLKNMKTSMFANDITLPEEYCKEHNLSSRIVKGSIVRKIWNLELKTSQELRTLSHLRKEDVYPTNMEEMNVGSAIRFFFSLKTAAAIEFHVKLKILTRDALAISHFIRVIEEWFSVAASKIRKTSITKRNKEFKHDILERVINLFENTVIGNRWKPLNTGLIMSSLTLIDISETLMSNNFEFVLGHRFTQDALENIFSQVRRKARATPTAEDCLRALKTISISQFISDIKRSSYCSDSDVFLLDFFSAPSVPLTSKKVDDNNKYLKFEQSLPTDAFETIHFDGTIIHSTFTEFELNNLYHIAGSITNQLIKSACEACVSELKQKLPDQCHFKKFSSYTNMLNKGGLQEPCYHLFSIVLNTEFLYKKYKSFVIHNSSKSLIEKIVKDLQIEFPICCKGCTLV